jgi:hypothetical protein
MARRQQTQTNIRSGQQLQSIATATESSTTVRSDGKGEKFLRELSVAKEGFSALIGYAQQNQKQASESAIAQEKAKQDQLTRSIQLQKMEQSIISAEISKVNTAYEMDQRAISKAEKVITDAEKAKTAEAKRLKDIATKEKEIRTAAELEQSNLTDEKQGKILSVFALNGNSEQALESSASFGEEVYIETSNAVARKEFGIVYNELAEQQKQLNAEGGVVNYSKQADDATAMLTNRLNELGIPLDSLDTKTINHINKQVDSLQSGSLTGNAGVQVKAIAAAQDDDMSIYGMNVNAIMTAEVEGTSEESLRSKLGDVNKFLDDKNVSVKESSSFYKQAFVTWASIPGRTAEEINQGVELINSLGDSRSMQNIDDINNLHKDIIVKKKKESNDWRIKKDDLLKRVQDGTLSIKSNVAKVELINELGPLANGDSQMADFMNELVVAEGVYDNKVKREKSNEDGILADFGNGDYISSESSKTLNNTFDKKISSFKAWEDPRAAIDYLKEVTAGKLKGVITEENLSIGDGANLKDRNQLVNIIEVAKGLKELNIPHHKYLAVLKASPELEEAADLYNLYGDNVDLIHNYITLQGTDQDNALAVANLPKIKKSLADEGLKKMMDETYKTPDGGTVKGSEFTSENIQNIQTDLYHLYATHENVTKKMRELTIQGSVNKHVKIYKGIDYGETGMDYQEFKKAYDGDQEGLFDMIGHMVTFKDDNMPGKEYTEKHQKVVDMILGKDFVHVTFAKTTVGGVRGVYAIGYKEGDKNGTPIFDIPFNEANVLNVSHGRNRIKSYSGGKAYRDPIGKQVHTLGKGLMNTMLEIANFDYADMEILKPGPDFKGGDDVKSYKTQREDLLRTGNLDKALEAQFKLDVATANSTTPSVKLDKTRSVLLATTNLIKKIKDNILKQQASGDKKGESVSKLQLKNIIAHREKFVENQDGSF